MLKILRLENTMFSWAVVVAQLLERLLPTPLIRGSNPAIGKASLLPINCIINCFEKSKIKKKWPGIA